MICIQNQSLHIQCLSSRSFVGNQVTHFRRESSLAYHPQGCKGLLFNAQVSKASSCCWGPNPFTTLWVAVDPGVRTSSSIVSKAMGGSRLRLSAGSSDMFMLLSIHRYINTGFYFCVPTCGLLFFRPSKQNLTVTLLFVAPLLKETKSQWNRNSSSQVPQWIYYAQHHTSEFENFEWHIYNSRLSLELSKFCQSIDWF